MKSWLIGLLLLSTGVAHSRMAAPHAPIKAVDAQQKYDQAITQFYNIAKNIGVPSNQALRRLKPLITPSLYSLLVAARQREDQCVAVAKKDEKPDIIDQSLFSGTVEGLTKIQGIDPYLRQNSSFLATISVINDSSPDSIMTWKNTIRLVISQNRFDFDAVFWEIDDIEFDVERNVYKTSSGTLRKRLTDYLSQTKKSCIPKKHQSK